MAEKDSQERSWGMLCHLSALSMFVVPMGNILGPLLIWLIQKDKMPFVDEQGKEALNFQISVTIYLIGAGILCIILIGLPLLIGILIAQVVLTIIASIKVNNGEEYRYPFTLRFIQ